MLVRYCTLAIAILMLVCGTPSFAAVIHYKTFRSTQGLKLNGDARPEGELLRLAKARQWSGGSVFSEIPVKASRFSTAFSFRITEKGGIHDGTSTGADGIVFVIQNISSSMGGKGGGIGYEGIRKSIGIEFDTWKNGFDPDSNHIGIDLDGNLHSKKTVHVSPDFDNGSIWHAWVDYDGSLLSVRVSTTEVRPAEPTISYPLDVSSIIKSETAYIGFTSATGLAYGYHDILSWEYRDYYDPVGGLLQKSVPLSLNIQPEKIVMRPGQRHQVRAIITPSQQDMYNIKWSLDGDSIVELAESGPGRISVTARRPGHTRITAEHVSSGSRAYCEIEVIPTSTIQKLFDDEQPRRPTVEKFISN